MRKRVERRTGEPRAVQEVFARLSELYPDASTELVYADPFQLLVAVILSAQCTDERVNQTTPALFARFPTPEALAGAKLPEIERLIHSCGFFRAKAKALKGMAQALLERFEGRVPRSLEELVQLPGVGRKTASVILNQAFDLPAIAVDTHVARVSQRLGWAKSEDPVKIESELKALLPESQWAAVNGRLILHGRRLCKARKPLCEQCPVSDHCAYFRATRARANVTRRGAASPRSRA